MRLLLLALCLCVPLGAAGCTRTASATHEPEATVEPPSATVAPPAAPAAPPAPVALGEDEDGNVVYAADLEALRLALKDADTAVRRNAVKRLARVRWKFPEPVGTILKQALADIDVEIRIEAIHAAAADPLRTPDVARLLRDPHQRVQVVAAQVLASQGKHEAEAYSILAVALADRQTADRPALLSLLRARAPASRPALPALVAMSLDPKEPLRVEAIGIAALLGASQESLDALLLVAHEADPKVRAAALRAVGRLDPQSAKVQTTLVRAMRDPQLEVALAATEAAGRDAIPLLIERLRHGDERVRDASVRALGRLGPEAWSAVPELQRVAQADPVQRVRQAATVALKAIVPAL